MSLRIVVRWLLKNNIYYTYMSNLDTLSEIFLQNGKKKYLIFIKKITIV